jgi:hypothetical protein
MGQVWSYWSPPPVAIPVDEQQQQQETFPSSTPPPSAETEVKVDHTLAKALAEASRPPLTAGVDATPAPPSLPAPPPRRELFLGRNTLFLGGNGMERTGAIVDILTGGGKENKAAGRTELWQAGIIICSAQRHNLILEVVDSVHKGHLYCFDAWNSVAERAIRRLPRHAPGPKFVYLDDPFDPKIMRSALIKDLMGEKGRKHDVTFIISSSAMLVVPRGKDYWGSLDLVVIAARKKAPLTVESSTSSSQWTLKSYYSLFGMDFFPTFQEFQSFIPTQGGAGEDQGENHNKLAVLDYGRKCTWIFASL